MLHSREDVRKRTRKKIMNGYTVALFLIMLTMVIYALYTWCILYKEHQRIQHQNLFAAGNNELAFPKMNSNNHTNMRVRTDKYVYDIDEEGVTATCRQTEQRSLINNFSPLMGYFADEEGTPDDSFFPRAVKVRLENPETIFLLEQELDREREEGWWHDN